MRILPCSVFFRRIFTNGLKFTKDSGEKGSSSEVIQKAPCPSGPGSKSVCLYDSPIPDKTCKAGEADPEWEPAEALPPPGPRVVVLGAGPAGLTAADRLVASGVNDVVVLEAGCRAGGRLRSRWAEDTIVELGLSRNLKSNVTWDHPLVQLGSLPPPFGTDPTAGMLQPPVPLPLLFQTYVILDELQNNKDSKITGYKGVRVEQIGRSLSSCERDNAARTMAAISALLGVKPKIVEDGFGAYMEAPGGSRVPLGESRFLLPLLKRIGHERVLYRKEAVNIRWGTVTPDQKPRAIVRCSDGSEYPAEFVILTLSLGCLKRNLDSMFYPPLPPGKTTAIQDAEFVCENKAFLVFEDPIWSWTDSNIDFNLQETVGIEKKEKRNDWTDCVTEIRKEEGSEKVVRVTVVGEGAVAMERATDGAVTDLLLSLLQEKLCTCVIPHPKKVIRSKWCDGRHSLGLRAAPVEDPKVLAAPLPAPDYLPPVLLFAGEGTAATPGLQGAVLSGLREADRLLAILKTIPQTTQQRPCPRICK